ncbi:MAG: RNA methyltransferase [Chloroflexota bacterium]|nr:RNA methyltransferase [Chloroflexota bacterium]
MITSVQNATVRSIRDLLKSRERNRTGLFVLEGIRPVIAAIQACVEIEMIVTAPNLLRSPAAWRLVAEQRANGRRVIDTSEHVFRGLSSRDHPYGLLCVGRQRWHEPANIPPPRGLGWVGLIEPRDPGNLGTILRVCDAVGCEAVFVLGHGAVDPYHPAALRAAMGSTFAVPLARIGFDEFVSLVRRHEIPLIGASDDAGQDYRSYRFSGPSALLMGRETAGATREERAATTRMVRIPMGGSCDSLNLAVATSLILYEAFHQRRSRED